MTSLNQKIQEDMKSAMRSHDAAKLGTLRMLLADIKNAEKEKQARGEAPSLIDDEVIDLVARGIKKRKDAAELYRKGGRDDLAKKEEGEIVVLREYLPPSASPEEVERVVDRLITSGVREKGPLMRDAAKALRGRVDNKELLEMIMRKLA